MTNKVVEALENIKKVFAGDARPHWSLEMETTLMRSSKLDLIDSVMPQAKAMAELVEAIRKSNLNDGSRRTDFDKAWQAYLEIEGKDDAKS